MLFEQFSRAKEDFTTFRRWHQSPFLKGCSGGGNGGICISLARKRKISQDFTCCRIVISKVLAAFRALPFPSDVVLKYVSCSGHRGSPVWTSCSVCFCGLYCIASLGLLGDRFSFQFFSPH